MLQIVSFAGVPVAVILSFVLALGIELALLAGVIHLIQRGVARAVRVCASQHPALHDAPAAAGHQDSVR